MGEGNLTHFSTLNSLGKDEPKSLKEYTDLLSILLQQFDVRFEDFKVKDFTGAAISTYFNAVCCRN